MAGTSSVIYDWWCVCVWMNMVFFSCMYLTAVKCTENTSYSSEAGTWQVLNSRVVWKSQLIIQQKHNSLIITMNMLNSKELQIYQHSWWMFHSVRHVFFFRKAYKKLVLGFVSIRGVAGFPVSTPGDEKRRRRHTLHVARTQMQKRKIKRSCLF